MSKCHFSERSRQKAKLTFIIIITTCMFITEIATGYVTNSLALVNDSFNMISDLLSLVIGFVCLLLSTKENRKNTYGWARVEIWAALINSVFLLALCFSIFTGAVQRLVTPEQVNSADLVLIVGGVGLCVNLVGVAVFFDETFGGLEKIRKSRRQRQQQQRQEQEHGDGQRREKEKEEVSKSETNVQLGRDAGNVNSCFACDKDDVTEIGFEPPQEKTRKLSANSIDFPKNCPGLEIGKSMTEVIRAIDNISGHVADERSSSSESRISVMGRRSMTDGSDCLGISGREGGGGGGGEEEEDAACPCRTDCINNEGLDSSEPTLTQIYAGPALDDEDEIPKRGSRTEKKKKKIKSGNEMNIRGILIHLLGDAMGSVSVIVSGLINKYCQGDWVSRMDPAISLLVVIFLVATTVPLLRQSSNILLQRIPRNVNVPALLEELHREVKDIANIHDLHVWQLVGTRIIASMHIRCSDLSQYIRASKKIKTFFHNNGIHSTTIQPEFLEHMEASTNGECFLECGPEMKCHEDTCCCAVKKSKKKISTTSTASGISFQSAISTDTAISVGEVIGTSRI